MRLAFARISLARRLLLREVLMSLGPCDIPPRRSFNFLASRAGCGTRFDKPLVAVTAIAGSETHDRALAGDRPRHDSFPRWRRWNDEDQTQNQGGARTCQPQDHPTPRRARAARRPLLPLLPLLSVLVSRPHEQVQVLRGNEHLGLALPLALRCHATLHRIRAARTESALPG